MLDFAFLDFKPSSLEESFNRRRQQRCHLRPSFRIHRLRGGFLDRDNGEVQLQLQVGGLDDTRNFNSDKALRPALSRIRLALLGA